MLFLDHLLEKTFLDQPKDNTRWCKFDASHGRISIILLRYSQDDSDLTLVPLRETLRGTSAELIYGVGPKAATLSVRQPGTRHDDYPKRVGRNRMIPIENERCRSLREAFASTRIGGSGKRDYSDLRKL
jgi:hypothetical protein